MDEEIKRSTVAYREAMASLEAHIERLCLEVAARSASLEKDSFTANWEQVGDLVFLVTQLEGIAND
jgi:hypothetical protein